LFGELDEERKERSSFFTFSTTGELTTAISSKLTSFLVNPPILISGDDHTHHKLIVMILILEHACLSYASQSNPTRDEALDRAYVRYCASGVHDNVTKQFFEPPKEYSILQFTEFILKHRL